MPVNRKMKIKILSFIPAIAFFIISIVLLLLPADDLPKSGFFEIPYFDKYVHFGMFFLLTFLFCYPFTRQATTSVSLFTKIALWVIVYGIVIEFIQKYFVPNRSFDMVDIVFDSLGSVTGLFGITRFDRKKIGPNGNRGRNQN